MKVIDLLNKIANGEEVPKIIKYDTINYFFRSYDYKEVHGELIDEQSSWIEKIDFYKLNDEVEILEEEKKIPEKLENEKEFYAYTRYEENKDEIDKVLYILKAINLAEEKIDNLNNSINSIIDYLKSKGE